MQELAILREVVRNSPVHFAVYDTQDRLLAWNQTYESNHPEAFSLHRSEIEDGSFDYAALLRYQLSHFYSGPALDQEVARLVALHRNADGTPVIRQYDSVGHLKIYKYALPSGAIAGLAVDINDLKDTEALLESAREAAHAAEQQLKDAIDVLPAAVAIFDPNARLLAFNEAYCESMGPAGPYVRLGLTYEQLLRSGPVMDDDNGADAWFEKRMADFDNASQNVETQTTDGRYIRLSYQRTSSGNTVCFGVDVTQAKLSQAKALSAARALRLANEDIQKQALQDELTGLPNRRHMNQFLRALNRDESSSSGLYLLHIDLDRFKQINDSIGHAAGDFIINHVGGILRVRCTGPSLVARFGGDEFVIALTDIDSDKMVRRFAEEIVREVSLPIEYKGHSCRIGASVGIARSESRDFNPDQLLANADVALYRAKEQGRGCVEFFTPEVQAQVISKKKVSDELLAAIDQKDFFAVYQPQFKAGSLALHGMETLVRWRHPTRGVLTPYHFLDTANDLNVLGDIDALIFEEAQEDLEILRAVGIEVPRISFNIAESRLHQSGLVQQLINMRDTGISVAVELLESLSLDAPEPEIGWLVDNLKDNNIDVEIDDFGSCRASIVGLMSVAPSTLKIDKQIVLPCTHSQKHCRLVSAIVEIGAALDIRVVAEGVETVDHVQTLTALGCDILQGYALALPMAADTLIPFLQDQCWRSIVPKQQLSPQRRSVG